MREVFRFWGFGPDELEKYVGPEGLIQQKTNVGSLNSHFGLLKFSGIASDYLKNVMKDQDPIYGYILCKDYEIYSCTPIVTLDPLDGSKEIVLISLDETGNFQFWFNLDETIEYQQQEEYFETRAPLYVKLGFSPEDFPTFIRKLALTGFRLIRILLKFFEHRNKKIPDQFKYHSVDIFRFLIREILHIAGASEPVPLWPEGKSYAVVLNHDIDTAWGIDHPNGIQAFRESEEKYGFRSAWMVVTQLHEVGRKCFNSLIDNNHEIGCHSTVHDHNIAYFPVKKIKQRLQSAENFLTEFNCVGFRSPSYHRSQNLFQGLDGLFKYDMSMHDTYEDVNSPIPSRQGCHTCFPFRLNNSDVLELPTTITEDYQLEMAGYSGQQASEIQISEIKKIAQRHGLANILTHPEKQLSAREEWHNCYDQVLKFLVTDTEAWVALPMEVAN